MTSSNITPEDLLLGYANPAYDQHAKRLLAQKDVVARILKGVVPEFRRIDLATIIGQCIEGEPEIGAIPVDMDKTNAARRIPMKFLFRDTAKSAAEKKKILESEFDLDISSDMEKEMNTMCNLSEGIFERGIVQGIERGIEQGIEQGESGMILSMLKKGYDLTSIADISQWSIKKIEQLAKAHHLL